MQHLSHSAKGLSLLIELNWDRLLVVGALAASLAAASYMGSM